jgi:exopolysaccharide biosynthesis polyprenyl glycosylphosphotransferase
MQIFADRLQFWDCVVSAAAVFFAYLVNVGDLETLHAQAVARGDLVLILNPIALAITIITFYWFYFLIFRSNRSNLAGTGVDEYLMVTKVSVAVVLTLSFMALAFKLDVSRLFVFEAITIATLLLIWHRWMGRQWLLRKRAQGIFSRRVSLVGPPNRVLDTVLRLIDHPRDGYLPVAAVIYKDALTDSYRSKFQELGLAVINYEEAGRDLIDGLDLDTVIVIGGEKVDANSIKRISWSLEGTKVEMVVSPGLIDIAAPRINATQVAGMQLLHIDMPTFDGLQFFVKRTMDLILSVTGIIFASPIFLVTSIAVWLEDRGPVLFFQERAGLKGKTFKMIKFRSMSVGAHEQHDQMMAEANTSPNSVMYKNPNDPRVTKVGRFIRKWSIDELPQLFNVFSGDMSMVGPRPPLLSEVAVYGTSDTRRLLVKPGITGLWQTSGRANLDWEATVRLDLDYVENWNPAMDVFLILKTLKAVINRGGAY